jgi:translation initiation factor IF-2
MSDSDNQERKTPLKLSQPGKLELKKTVESGQVRQSFSHGRSKVVTVEVRKKRTFTADAGGAMHEVRGAQPHSGAEAELAKAVAIVEAAQQAASAHDLTNHEKVARAKALETAMKTAEEARLRAEEEARIRAQEEAAAAEQSRIEAEEAARRAAEAPPAPEPAPVEAPAAGEAPAAPPAPAPAPAPAPESADAVPTPQSPAGAAAVSE